VRRGRLAAALLGAVLLAAACSVPGRVKIADVYWEIVLALRLVSPASYVGPHQWAVALSPDGGQLAVGGMYPEPLLYDLRTGARLPAPTAHREWVMEVGWSADGRYFASTDFSGSVAVRDLEEDREVGRWSGRDVAYTFAFHPARPLMAWGAYDGSIRLVDLRDGRTLRTVPANEGGVLYVTFTPDGRRLVSTGEDGRVRFFDPDTGAPGAQWSAHAAGITSIAFRADGQRAVTGGDDAMVRLWDVPSGRLLEERSPHRGWVNFSTFLADGRYVTVGTSDDVFVWPAEPGAPPRALDAGGWLMCARPLPDGSGFATAGKDGVVRIWDAGTLRVRRTIDAFADVDPGGFRWPAL
jgi:WD40 repeat protein